MSLEMVPRPMPPISLLLLKMMMTILMVPIHSMVTITTGVVLLSMPMLILLMIVQRLMIGSYRVQIWDLVH